MTSRPGVRASTTSIDGRYELYSNIEVGAPDPTEADVRVIPIANMSEGMGYLYNREGWISWPLPSRQLGPIL